MINIESVNVVVTPEGKNEWTKNMDNVNANSFLRTQFLDKFAQKIYQDLIVSRYPTQILFNLIYSINLSVLESPRCNQEGIGDVQENRY